MADIFISHSTKDIEISNAICKAIEDYGYTCWISDRDILGGMDFAETIAIAIERCKIMVLVFSQNSNTSPEVKNEIVLAGQSMKVVIPLLTENIKVSPAFRYHLASRQWIDCTKGWEDSLIPLFTQLKQLIGDPPNPPKKSELYKGVVKESDVAPAVTSIARTTMKPSEAEKLANSDNSDATEEALRRAREIDAQRFIEEEKAKQDAAAKADADAKAANQIKQAREAESARAREEEAKKKEADRLAALKAKEAKDAADAKSAKKTAEELVSMRQAALVKHADKTYQEELLKATSAAQIVAIVQKFEKNKLAQAQAAVRKAQLNQQISKATIAAKKNPILVAGIVGLVVLAPIAIWLFTSKTAAPTKAVAKTEAAATNNTNEIAANAVVEPPNPVDGYLQSYVGNYVVFTSNCETGTKFVVSRDDGNATGLAMTANSTPLYKFNFDSRDESGKDHFTESDAAGKQKPVTFESSISGGITKLSVTDVPALRKCG
ncbi:MAG: hypothetical protein FD163_760 [Hyphomonadaceae bacterium]|nr:MAG: hypothetical protein FD128_1959 [Hyphomonadaceae bacterium]KAF0186092.1 MAG: hypothetical protein FD163_760 [Hyphomonadaceae bacterium]